MRRSARLDDVLPDEAFVEQGFTILEIMIATAILTLGLVGILALFPVAIFYGKQIVEKSTASVIAESVAEAIREGLRNNLRATTKNQNGVTHHYFILKHDGVQEAPSDRKLESPEKEYYILLPRFRPGREGVFASRESAQNAARTFVYPETDRSPAPNGGGDAFHSDDDADDYQRTLTTGETRPEIFVDRTYSVGKFLPAQDPSLRGEGILDDQKIETLKQYSFALEIQSSTGDANLDWSQQRFQPANRLYRVRVLIYRGFPEGVPDQPVVLPAPVEPVFELDFEVSI